MLSIGDKIPSIKLKAYHQNKIKEIDLGGFKNKWLVILFYPADFTFVCPTELKEGADYYKEFKKNGAEVLSISTDSVYSHKAWHDTSPLIKKVTYPMLSDPNGKASRQFGTYIEEEGISLRASFIFDAKGILRAFEMHDDSIGRNTAELFRKFQAAKFCTEHKGQACPASWQPGKKTLKTSLNLVGKL